MTKKRTQKALKCLESRSWHPLEKLEPEVARVLFYPKSRYALLVIKNQSSTKGITAKQLEGCLVFLEVHKEYQSPGIGSELIKKMLANRI